jgi:soluble lytic murein transglycosylase-like protein
VRAENFAAGLYAYAPDAYAPAFATRETRLRRNSGRQSEWGQNNWSQSNGSQNNFNQSTPLDGMATAQASANGVPVLLVNRVIKRESGGNPRAVSRGNYGLMQIRLGTARAMGFSGSAAELLDPQINMTYAVRYLAGAYRAAGGNENRAVALYASGYYDQAKAQGFSPYAAEASSGFAAYRPVAFQADETFGNTAPVYRTRHHRHRAV